MTSTEIYKQAIDTAARTILEEDGSLNMNKIARKMDISPELLKESIPDRKQFSTQVSIKVGAKIWEREAEIFGKVIESEQYRSLNGAAQIRELFSNSFLRSFRGHPDFWRWLHRFEQFIVTEKIPAESSSLHYLDQIRAGYQE